jgi:protein deglycase
MNILVPLAEGLEEIEAVTIIDVLRRAGLTVRTAALGDTLQVEGAHHILLQADTLLSQLDLDEFQAVVLPGGGVGTDNLMADQRIFDIIRSFYEQGRYVCAICAAPTLLAQAGILEGLKGTCYPSCAKMLAESYSDVPVVADGNIITGQGPGTAMLFSLVLVHHFAGEDVARTVAKAMLSTY